MKPSPPDHLLAGGQSWTVVEAPWGLLPGPFKERIGCSGYQCDMDAVIYSLDDSRIIAEALCVEHLGMHRWIDGNKVMQWKADPPYVYKKPIQRRIRSRKDWLV